MIKGIEEMSTNELVNNLRTGAKVVVYQYTVSIIFMTFKRASKKIYYIPHEERSFGRGLKYSLITFLFGWWGVPWGPVYTIQSIFRNLSGGIDVTDSVLKDLGVDPEVKEA